MTTITKDIFIIKYAFASKSIFKTSATITKQGIALFSDIKGNNKHAYQTEWFDTEEEAREKLEVRRKLKIKNLRVQIR